MLTRISRTLIRHPSPRASIADTARSGGAAPPLRCMWRTEGEAGAVRLARCRSPSAGTLEPQVSLSGITSLLRGTPKGSEMAAVVVVAHAHHMFQVNIYDTG